MNPEKQTAVETQHGKIGQCNGDGGNIRTCGEERGERRKGPEEREEGTARERGERDKGRMDAEIFEAKMVRTFSTLYDN